jgi:hypothetical protein
MSRPSRLVTITCSTLLVIIIAGATYAIYTAYWSVRSDCYDYGTHSVHNVNKDELYLGYPDGVHAFDSQGNDRKVPACL